VESVKYLQIENWKFANWRSVSSDLFALLAPRALPPSRRPAQLT
jgi:hypothetical protein